VVSRAFSGRAGRSIATDYVRAAIAPDAPAPAPYPVCPLTAVYDWHQDEPGRVESCHPSGIELSHACNGLAGSRRALHDRKQRHRWQCGVEYGV
jgi:hypothetical protein